MLLLTDNAITGCEVSTVLKQSRDCLLYTKKDKYALNFVLHIALIFYI